MCQLVTIVDDAEQECFVASRDAARASRNPRVASSVVDGNDRLHALDKPDNKAEFAKAAGVKRENDGHNASTQHAHLTLVRVRGGGGSQRTRKTRHSAADVGQENKGQAPAPRLTQPPSLVPTADHPGRIRKALLTRAVRVAQLTLSVALWVVKETAYAD
ncbi:hypothetical protein PYCCODRAFT_1426726 [Trametes coccinea BRFM310]|uniref:Uncharacterized protein n=1 Tax=Trametes coccinea (strain BRFM310) TaxID=1353009 RepID=A0A1Y2IIM7_TRAC3|nr:hypothetical protein PYCCODRAFT_1426726 [Trametes coccinea BRFM310]